MWSSSIEQHACNHMTSACSISFPHEFSLCFLFERLRAIQMVDVIYGVMLEMRKLPMCVTKFTYCKCNTPNEETLRIFFNQKTKLNECVCMCTIFLMYIKPLLNTNMSICQIILKILCLTMFIHHSYVVVITREQMLYAFNHLRITLMFRVQETCDANQFVFRQ